MSAPNPCPIGPTGECFRILQIHPTRRCNLRCAHCYSLSGPEAVDEIEAELLCQAISDASRQGYTLAGFSGGEPLLYDKLPVLLDHARQLGMLTTVTTNGMLLTGERLSELRDRVDLLAISLDGVPASHNRIRDHDRAFEIMSERLDGVRRAGIPFGFIFTLTLYNVHELRWAAEFALEQGAGLLQIHPLEEVGRAAQEMVGGRPDQTEAAVAYLEALWIQANAGERLRVHIDLADRELLRMEPSRAFADRLPDQWQSMPLSALVNPLVVEADGTVVPVQHGFDRRFALGDLRAASLADLAERWRRHRYAEFRALCRRAWQGVVESPDCQLVNWYESLQREALRFQPA
jgi:MoaA/NifB/PqqE/SkfB family radical SAM enzyme